VREHADALASVDVDGEPGFVVRAEDADELAATPDTPAGDVVLLPAFDPWVLAPVSHRKRAVPPGRESDVSRAAGWISPVLVVDGAVAGVWEHEGIGSELAVTVRPFTLVDAAARRAAERHARRHGELLDATAVRITWA
jgi:hypothetical protein